MREHPLRERLWAQLMTALYRAGRQGDALRAYQRARARARRGARHRPRARAARARTRVLEQDPALGAPRTAADDGAHRPPTNLPVPADALIGRTTEIGATRALLEGHRVVTIVGPGGVGKTRLAAEVGHRHSDRTPTASGLPTWRRSAMRPTLPRPSDRARRRGRARPRRGRTPIDRLREYLFGRELSSSSTTATRRRRGRTHRCRPGRAQRQLQVLATSRESLAIAGEALWPLSPLALDDAIELFVRARGRRSGVRSRQQLRGGSGDLRPARRPAARDRTRRGADAGLAPSDLLTRLDDRFRLLTGGSRTAPPRQQTLRAVIDWSYALLFEQERLVFERASVFAGGFSLTAAEAVCSGPGVDRADVADLLRGSSTSRWL